MIDHIYSITQGRGCTVSIDAAGFAATCEQAVASTQRHGRMVQVGLPLGGKPPQIPMGMVVAKELELVGSHGFQAVDLANLLKLVEDGTLNVKQLVEREVSLEEGVKVLMEMDGKSPLGMTMITQFDDGGPNSRL